MSKYGRLTSHEIIYLALVWADESMVQMINGCSVDDPYRAEVIDKRKQMIAYRKRRFGVEVDPFEGATALNLDELRKLRATASLSSGDSAK